MLIYLIMNICSLLLPPIIQFNQDVATNKETKKGFKSSCYKGV
jgi:hypothetical protein